MFLRATFTLACVVACTAAGVRDGMCPKQYGTYGPDKVAVLPCGSTACALPTYLPLNESLQLCDQCTGMLPIDVDVQESGEDGNYTLTFGVPSDDNVTIDLLCGTCTAVGTISLQIPCHQTPPPQTPTPPSPGHLCPKQYESDGPDKVTVIPCGQTACALPTYLPLNESLQLCDRCTGMLPIDIDVQEVEGDEGNYTLTFGTPSDDNVTIDLLCGTCTAVGTISLEIPCNATTAPQTQAPLTLSPPTPSPPSLCPKQYETDGPDKVAVIPCGQTACAQPTYLPLNESLQLCDRCTGMLPIDIDVQEVEGDEGNYTLTFGVPSDDNVTIDLLCGTCTAVGTISLEIPCNATTAPQTQAPLTLSPPTPSPPSLCPKQYETDGPDKVTVIPCGSTACALPTYLPLNESLQMCDRCIGMLPIDIDVQEVEGDEGNYTLTFGAPPDDNVTIDLLCGTCTAVGTISLEIPCQTPAPPTQAPLTLSPSTPSPPSPGHLCPKQYETDGPDKVACIPCGQTACALPTYLPLNESLQMCDQCVGMLPIDIDVQEVAGDEYTLTFGVPHGDKLRLNVSCGTCTAVGTISLQIPCHAEKKKHHRSALFVLPIVAGAIVALVGGAMLLRHKCARTPTDSAEEKLPLVGTDAASATPLQEGNAATLNLQQE